MSASKESGKKSNVITGPWDGSSERAPDQPVSWWVELTPYQQHQASAAAAAVFKQLLPPRPLVRQPGKRRDHAPVTFLVTADGTYGYPLCVEPYLRPWSLTFNPHASEFAGMGAGTVARMRTHHEMLNITGRLIDHATPNPAPPAEAPDLPGMFNAAQEAAEWGPEGDPGCPF